MPNKRADDRRRITINMHEALDDALRKRVVKLQDSGKEITLGDYAAAAILEALVRDQAITVAELKTLRLTGGPVPREAGRSGRESPRTKAAGR